MEKNENIEKNGFIINNQFYAGHPDNSGIVFVVGIIYNFKIYNIYPSYIVVTFKVAQ